MKQVMIHMGAHRCASSATQALMRRNRAAIEAAGAALFLRQDMEAPNARLDLRGLFRDSSFNPIAKVRFANLIRTINALPEQRILASEENMIGTMPGQFDRRFYPGFGNFLRFLKQLGRKTDLSVRFITRRQDRFLDSIYAFRVAFGLAVDFPTFLKQIDANALSWARLVKQVDKAGLAGRTRIQVLELLPRDGVVLQLQQFLGIDDLFDGSGETLSGNASFTGADLKLLLALNRLELGLDTQWRRAKLFGALRVRKHEADADILEACGLDLTSDQLAQIAALTGEATQLKLDDDQRARLLKHYAAENRDFLAHPSVNAPADVWGEHGLG